MTARGIFSCHACGKPTHIDLLDAKPGDASGVKEGAPDWERFECWACYGPGYAVHDPAMLKPASAQMTATMKARAA